MSTIREQLDAMPGAFRTIAIEKLHKQIDKLLETGFATDVNQEDIRKICLIFEDIIALKYDMNESGDYPIEIDLTDRTKYERPHYMSVPYDHKENISDMEKLQPRLHNLEVASKEMNQFLMKLRMREGANGRYKIT